MKELLRKFSPPQCHDSYMISFEGIEGAGKSTHIQKLKEIWESAGYHVLLLREPGGTPFGEILRTAILQSNAEIAPLAEAHLFASSRAQLLSNVTLPALAQKKTIVIYDRYIDSSLAYQGVARKLGIDTVLKIHSDFPLTTVPHLTLYLKISLETSHQRQIQRNKVRDYFESKNLAFYQALLDGYQQVAELFKDRIVIINGEQKEEAVYQEIKDCISNRLLFSGNI